MAAGTSSCDVPARDLSREAAFRTLGRTPQADALARARKRRRRFRLRQGCGGQAALPAHSKTWRNFGTCHAVALTLTVF
jgi:hypothetical protein